MKTFVLLILFPFFIPSLALGQSKVIVVGAGLSGLTVAYRLLQSGYDVEVYEARKRPGGRVFSVNVGGFIEELGGKDLSDGGDASSILSLAKELQLSASMAPASHLDQYFDSDQNKVIDSDCFEDGFPMLNQTMLDRLSYLQSQAKNLGEVLDSFFSDYPLRKKIFRIRVRNFQGAEPEQLAPSEVDGLIHLLKLNDLRRQEKANKAPKEFKYTDVPGGFKFLTIDGGNARLVEELVKR